MANSGFLPVLIIPGFMSSGLEVKESTDSRWTGKRVWLNLGSIGFQSLHTGGALQANEERRRQNDRRYSQKLHDQYQEEMNCKSLWLQHMALQDDMVSERKGIKVRPIEGLAGVDYLTPGALTNHVSYVFGPVIQALISAGFEEGKNLDAAPYDWRLPPSELEKRDHYFSSTMEKVEELYKKNNKTPVVLLCHSLGCKVGHYFLNFAKAHRKGGQRWIDKHIHTYMPVGAPHLGAPKSLRAMVNGDKMGLDAFLSDEEGMVLGRSLGSGPWLLPTTLPDHSAPPSAFMKREGSLSIELVSTLDLRSILRARDDPPAKFQLSVVVDGEVITTDFHSRDTVHRRRGAHVSFSEKFVFPTKPDFSPLRSAFQLLLLEPGLAAAKKDVEKDCAYFLGWGINCLLCPIKYVVCCPCTVACKLCGCVADATLASADVTAKAIGTSSVIASSEKVLLPQGLTKSKDGTVEFDIDLVHVKDKNQNLCFRKPKDARARVRMKWTGPPSLNRDTDDACAIAVSSNAPSSTKLHHLPIRDPKTQEFIHEHVSGGGILRREGLERVINLVGDKYDKDKMGPRGLSSVDPPPVKRVKAIYGVNLPTEVGAVYRTKPRMQGDGHVQNIYKLDTYAHFLPGKNGGEFGSYQLEGGIIKETKGTSQGVAVCPGESGTVVNRSGDGTVPYFSLQHCRTWSDACEVEIDEIDRADHREILADARFHKILIDYVAVKGNGVAVHLY